MELGWSNVYLRTDEKDLKHRVTTRPGWYAGKQQKIYLLGEYRKALALEEFINRSRIALKEAMEYIYSNAGGVEHATSMNIQDPSGAKENHGDRVIADALANLVMTKAGDFGVDEAPKALPGSLAHRRMQAQAQDRESQYVWN